MQKKQKIYKLAQIAATHVFLIEYVLIVDFMMDVL